MQATVPRTTAISCLMMDLPKATTVIAFEEVVYRSRVRTVAYTNYLLAHLVSCKNL
jgi:hypothetical protein